jgi:hypothetical protein
VSRRGRDAIPYARDWIKTYQGRTSSGVRESTRRWHRQVLEQRIIP